MITRKLRDGLESSVTGALGKTIGKLGISPNAFSFFALVLAAPACYFIVVERYLLAVLFVLLSGAVDLLDGCLARATGKATKFGSYWDAMLDRYVDCAIYLGFVLGGYALEGFLAAIGTVLTSYAKPRTAMVVEIFSQDWPTIGERTERFVLIIGGLLLASFVPRVAGFSTIGAMLWLTAAMTHFGAVQRIVYTYRLVGRPPEEGDGAE